MAWSQGTATGLRHNLTSEVEQGFLDFVVCRSKFVQATEHNTATVTFGGLLRVWGNV